MKKHFILLDKDYIIDPEFKRPPRKRNIALGLMALYALRKYQKRKNGSASGGKKSSSGGFVRPDNRQKCTVKMQYSRSLAAHKEQLGKYLAREGTGKDGNETKLYGSDLVEYQKKMVSKNFRIFLSPGNTKVPLESLAKTFVKHLELQTGYKLYWVAAEHYNTAHPHVHLLINGRDKTGKDIFFPRDVVKTFMRETARNICTSLVGSRTRQEILEEKQQQVTVNRYSYLDKKISEIAVDNTVFMSMIEGDKTQLVARLDHLRTMGLAKWKDGHYELLAKWEETLTAQSRYNVFLDARKNLKYTQPADLLLFEGSREIKHGLISKIYKPDELSNHHVIVLEAIDGKAYFVPLFKKPSIKEGDLVSIEPKKNEKGRLSPQIEKISKSSILNIVNKQSFGNALVEALRAGQENARSTSRE